MRWLWIACLTTFVLAAFAAEPPSEEAIAHYTKGVQHKQANRLKEAVTELTAAIKLSPDFLDAHWVLAWTYSALKQKDSAVAHFNEVIRIDPQGDKAAEARKTIERLGGEIKEPPPPPPPPEPEKAPEPPKPEADQEPQEETKPEEAPQPPPPPEPEKADEGPPEVGLWIDQFEDEGQKWFDMDGRNPLTLEFDRAHVKEGECSGKWDIDNAAPRVFLDRQHFLADWSEFDTLCFWSYAEKPTGTKFVLAIYSENEETEGQDYYTQVIEVNWEGWRLFKLPLATFASHRTPAGWEKVDLVQFAARGWDDWVHVVPGTVLYFDAMYLATTAGADRLLVFDPDTMENFWPLQPTTDFSRPGKHRSIAWTDTVAQGYTNNDSIPPDWSTFRYLHIWLHSAVANDARLAVNVHAENDQTEGQDYFGFSPIQVDWEGWQEVILDLNRARRAREPVGWDAITRLQIAARGFVAKPAPGTELHIGEVWLTKEKEPE